MRAASILVLSVIIFTTESPSVAMKCFESPSELKNASKTLKQKTFASENELRQKGFKESHIAGLNEVEKFIKVAEQLRSGNIDPKTDHIEYFAGLVNPHIKFIEEGIKSQTDFKDIAKRLSILADFKKEAQDRISKNKINYRWWVNFNFRLSILVTPESARTTKKGGRKDQFVKDLYKTKNWLSNDSLEKAYTKKYGRIFTLKTIGYYLDKFPATIIMPSISGDLGIFALNRTFMTGVHPFGLIRDYVWADGEKMYPDTFFRHDFVHLENYEYSAEGWSNEGSAIKKFHYKFLEKIEYLNKRDREMLELVYFITTHELTLLAIELTSGSAKYLTENLFDHRLSSMVGYSMDPTWYKNILPDWVDTSSPEQTKLFLIESGRRFNAFAQQINSGT